MANGKTLDLAVRILGQVDGSLTSALNSTTNGIESLAKTISDFGTAGLKAMTAFAAGTVELLGECTDKAAEFETVMADVTKYVGGLADEYGNISDSIAENGNTFEENYDSMKGIILDLSTQIPMTAEEIAQIAAAGGQSGFTQEELVKREDDGSISGFVVDAAIGSLSLDVSAEQAGEWMAQWENALGYSHDEVMEILDIVNYVAANSATTAADLASVVNDSLGLGSVAGLDPAGTIALADAMLATGTEPGSASTSIDRILINTNKGSSATAAQKAQWEALGFTAEGVASSMQEDATGTLLEIFEAISNLDADKRLAALNTLFNAWSAPDAAKIANNMQPLIDALEMSNSPDLYTGSMEREYNIKTDTTEATEQRLSSTVDKLEINIGDAFLPVEKELNESLIDFLNKLSDMPELDSITEKLGKLATNGVEWLGDKLEQALPYIEEFLDYLLNNGDEVVSIIETLVGTFTAMKLAPAAVNVASGVSSLLFGSSTGTGANATSTGGLAGIISSLWSGGQNLVTTATTGFGNTAVGQYLTNVGTAGSNFLTTTGTNAGNALLTLASSLSSNGTPTLNETSRSLISTNLSNIGTAGANLTSAVLPIQNTAVGRYATSVGNAGSSLLNLLNGGGTNTLNNTALTTGADIGLSAANFAGTVVSPVTSGLASIVSGATPVVLAVSGVIAVLSLLWDNIDSLEGPIESVFGEKGVEVFTSFKDGVNNALTFIQGLFDGGLADSLSGVRDSFAGALGGNGLLSTIFGGTEGGLAAFDGVVSILQSILTFIGQIVSFANTSVKPIIVDIFNFITGTVMPTVISIFSTAAPTISSIISSVGNIIMTVVQAITTVLNALMPSIETIIEAVLNIAEAVIPVILNAIDAILPVIQTLIDIAVPIITVAVSTIGGILSGLATSISEIIDGIMKTFNGIINFISDVFTGNWERIWDDIRDIFGGVWDSLVALLKTPVNAIIGIINGMIGAINSLSITIPDWVPILGGQSFDLDIPEIPLLARGGFTHGPSIAGEDGTEAVISFKNSEKAKNVSTWAKAGKMLGVMDTSGMADTASTASAAVKSIPKTASMDTSGLAQNASTASTAAKTLPSNLSMDTSGLADTPEKSGASAGNAYNKVAAIAERASSKPSNLSVDTSGLADRAYESTANLPDNLYMDTSGMADKVYEAAPKVPDNLYMDTSGMADKVYEVATANIPDNLYMDTTGMANKVYESAASTSLPDNLYMDTSGMANRTYDISIANIPENLSMDTSGLADKVYENTKGIVSDGVASALESAAWASRWQPTTYASTYSGGQVSVTAPTIDTTNSVTAPVIDTTNSTVDNTTVLSTDIDGETVEMPEIPENTATTAEYNITFAPQINIDGEASKSTVEAALRESEERFEAWIEANFDKLATRRERELSRRAYS